MAAAREQAQEELALGRQARPVAVAAERLRDARDRADLAGDAGLGVAPARRGLAAAPRPAAAAARTRRRCARRPRAEGSTSSMRQPLVAPTSMYSMKRSATSRPRKWRAIGRISWSLVPRLTTMLTLIGPRPARSAASMPRSTSATGKSASFMRRKIASSIASRLTVTRPSPAAFSAAALRARIEPLVVSVRSSGSPSALRSSASIATSRSRSRRSSGSPPVRRIFRTPWATNRRGEANDLLEGQQRRLRQEAVVAVEDFLRHAVAAAEIAAVGDRDAQVAQRPLQAVEELAGRRDEARRDRAARSRGSGGRRRR